MTAITEKTSATSTTVITTTIEATLATAITTTAAASSRMGLLIRSNVS